MRKARVFVVALPLLLLACTPDDTQRPVTTAAITPAAAQESVETRLIKGSTFTGTATAQNQPSYRIRMSFTKQGDELLAQYGSTGQVSARVSGTTVSFKFRYEGREMDAQLTLHDNGELKGTITGPGRSGALLREQVFLMAATS